MKKIIICAVISIILTGCVSSITGTKILSRDEYKNQPIKKMEITYINRLNPVNSKSITLLNNTNSDNAIIETLIGSINDSKATKNNAIFNYSPISQSSHFINIIFENESSLEFYYCDENHWLILNEVLIKNDKKVINYYFMETDERILDSLEALYRKDFSSN